jgi:hypothetical protein
MRDEVESREENCWASAMEVGISIRATLSVEYRMHDGSDDGLGDRSEVLDCLSGTSLGDDGIPTVFSHVLSEMWKSLDFKMHRRVQIYRTGPGTAIYQGNAVVD